MAASPLIWNCFEPGKWITACGRFAAERWRQAGVTGWDLYDNTGERRQITAHGTFAACQLRARIVLDHPHK